MTILKCSLSHRNVFLMDLYAVLGSNTTSPSSHFSDFAKQLMDYVALVVIKTFLEGLLIFVLTYSLTSLSIGSAKTRKKNSGLDSHFNWSYLW